VVLTTPTWVRRIECSAGFQPFLGFSSGKGEIEKKVDKIITDRFEGRGPVARWCVMETGSAGELVGVAAYFPRDLAFDLLPTPTPTAKSSNATLSIANTAYLHVIAISAKFRGRIMPNGVRLGTFLLRRTQGYIKRDWNGTMPWTWAYLERGNVPSHELFYREGFGCIPPQTAGEDFRYVWDPEKRFVDRSAPPPWQPPDAHDIAA
jgi:hypothetical protein